METGLSKKLRVRAESKSLKEVLERDEVMEAGEACSERKMRRQKI